MAASHVHRRPRPRAVTWVIFAIIAIVLFVVLWIAIRALMARDQLLAAEPLARSVSTAALDGKTASMRADERELEQRAASAASLTSDPIWRTVEIVPVLGDNLRAFRQSAQMIHEVADGALPPLTKLATTFSVSSFAPKNGVFNLQPFVTAAPSLGKARSALDKAGAQAAAIDTSNTLPQIGDAVDQLVTLVDQAKGAVDGLDTAANVLPTMLGGDGKRQYLLMSLNNAELRSTGGIPGAVALVDVDHGKLSLGTATSAAALGTFDPPVLPLSPAEKTLYSNTLGQYMQDVDYTPDFARSGELAQAMWKKRTGTTVDGVIALDPVALSYILGATGPVDAGSGVTLTSANAVQILLSTVYSKFPKPADQDAFFAGVTGKVFSAITSGHVDSHALINALVKSSSEQRIHVWSAHPSEQRELAGSTIAESLPAASTSKTSGFGVYFDDSTAAKMDYYLRSSIGIAGGMCRVDRRPNFDVLVHLTSTAPKNAATALPAYVTGGTSIGVKPGNVSTNVYVYAPAGGLFYGVTINHKQYAFVAAKHDGHTVAGVTVVLQPGESADVEFEYLGKAQSPTAQTLIHTPMASSVATSLDNFYDCPTAQPTTPGETGALGTAARSNSW